MPIARKDSQLLRALASIPNLEQRKIVIESLSPGDSSRLGRHLKGIIRQTGVYRLTGEKQREALKTALQPHKKLLSKFVGGGSNDFNAARKQRGGQIIPIVLSALAPLLVNLLAKQIMPA